MARAAGTPPARRRVAGGLLGFAEPDQRGRLAVAVAEVATQVLGAT
jgi:hypothetical protein